MNQGQCKEVVQARYDNDLKKRSEMKKEVQRLQIEIAKLNGNIGFDKRLLRCLNNE